MTESSQDHLKPVSPEDWYYRHRDAVFGYLVALLVDRDAATDVLQEVFLNCWKSQSKRPIENAEAYLIQSARHAAIRYREGRRREQVIRARLALERKPDAAFVAEPEKISRLQSALPRLPDEQREVIVMKCFQNRTFEAIGQLLDIPMKTAASRYRYGLEKLRDLLQEEDQ